MNQACNEYAAIGFDLQYYALVVLNKTETLMCDTLNLVIVSIFLMFFCSTVILGLQIRDISSALKSMVGSLGRGNGND